jgi:hypothetical protein
MGQKLLPARRLALLLVPTRSMQEGVRPPASLQKLRAVACRLQKTKTLTNPGCMRMVRTGTKWARRGLVVRRYGGEKQEWKGLCPDTVLRYGCVLTVAVRHFRCRRASSIKPCRTQLLF